MRKIFSLGMFTIMIFALAWSGADAQKGATDIDVQHYKIDAELIPASQSLKARAEVRFVPQTDTRTVVFEMNGSLTISRITRADAPAAPTTAAVNTSASARGRSEERRVGKECTTR